MVLMEVASEFNPLAQKQKRIRDCVFSCEQPVTKTKQRALPGSGLEMEGIICEIRSGTLEGVLSGSGHSDGGTPGTLCGIRWAAGFSVTFSAKFLWLRDSRGIFWVGFFRRRKLGLGDPGGGTGPHAINGV